MNAPHAPRRAGGRGQALVEFSLVLIPFLFLLMGIADLGRGIFAYNGVAEAAREIARVTSVHPCSGSPCTLGNSPETASVLATQKGLVPGLGEPSAAMSIQCTDLADQDLDNTGCRSGQFVRVSISVPFSTVTPLLGFIGPITLSSTSHVELP